MIEEIPKGIITHPDQVGGYPEYRGTSYPDTDSDGLPDAWEERFDFDPVNPEDAVGDADGDGYLNVEEFLNRTDPRQFVDYTDLNNNESGN